MKKIINVLAVITIILIMTSIDSFGYFYSVMQVDGGGWHAEYPSFYPVSRVDFDLLVCRMYPDPQAIRAPYAGVICYEGLTEARSHGYNRVESYSGYKAAEGYYTGSAIDNATLYVGTMQYGDFAGASIYW